MIQLDPDIYAFGRRNPIPALLPAAWFRKGIGQTVTGSGVSTWADQSGNSGRDLLQSTDAARPTQQADGSLLGDGVQQFMQTGVFTLNQPCTVYHLVKQISWTASDTFSDGLTTGAGQIFQRTASPNIGITAGNQIGDATGLAVGVRGVISAVFSGVSSLVQTNSDSPVTGNASIANPGGITLGRFGGGAAGFVNAQFYESIFFTSAHDATTRAIVIAYLNSL